MQGKGNMLQLFLLLVGVFAPLAATLPTISVKGAKFFADGQQLFIKGVAYQGTPDDPLIDTTQCTLDATLMGEIGANSIRVYHVNPYANHDGCMSAFAAKGIYVWLDLDTFNTTIPVQPLAPKWTEEQFAAFAYVADAFQGYDNLAGYWIGNEIITALDGSGSAPFIKAAVHDMKSYLSLKDYRPIPIGYSAADIAELRPALQNYLVCSTSDSAIDFFGLNSYEWCGKQSFMTSGYSNLQAMSEGYNIPIFFSETGCNVVPGGRDFGDQAAIFGPDMSGTWSGSIIYEWVQEANKYGLVDYPNGQIYSGVPTPIAPDFENLKEQWSNVKPVGVAEDAYQPSFSAPACPAASGGWQLNGDVPIPTLAADVIKAVAKAAVYTSAPSVPLSTKTPIITTTQASSSTRPMITTIPSQEADSSSSSGSFSPSESFVVSPFASPGTSSALSSSTENEASTPSSTANSNSITSNPSTKKSSTPNATADSTPHTPSTTTSPTGTEASAASPPTSKPGAAVNMRIPRILGCVLGFGVLFLGSIMGCV